MIQNYIEDVDKITREVDISIEDTLFGLFVKIYIDSQRAPQNEVWYEPNYFLNKVFDIDTHNFHRGQMGDSYEFFLFLYRHFDIEIARINQFVNSIRNSPRMNDESYNSNNPIRRFSDFFNFDISCKFNPAFPYYEKPEPVDTFNLIPIYPEREGVEKAILNFQKKPYFRNFLTLPDILVIKNNILGIDHDGKYYKNFEKTPIPFQIDLSTEKNGNNGSEKASYTLCAAVMHISEDANGGHFMTVIRICGGLVVFDDADIWGLNTDQLVNFISRNEVPGRERTSAAYILFYQKSD